MLVNNSFIDCTQATRKELQSNELIIKDQKYLMQIVLINVFEFLIILHIFSILCSYLAKIALENLAILPMQK